jgi:hypothetical protein
MNNQKAQPLADVSWNGIAGYGAVPNVEFFSRVCLCGGCTVGREILKRSGR